MGIFLFVLTIVILASANLPKGAIYTGLVIELNKPMQAVVSTAILGCALYVILSLKYGPQDKHWAYGSEGTILGYWLRPSK